MERNKNSIIADLKRLSNLLDAQYASELNFRNHCYLRIAHDNTVQDKWDNAIKRPFTKYAEINQLENSINLLKIYASNIQILLSDNEKSLSFRKKVEDFNTERKLSLFDDFNHYL